MAFVSFIRFLKNGLLLHNAMEARYFIRRNLKAICIDAHLGEPSCMGDITLTPLMHECIKLAVPLILECGGDRPKHRERLPRKDVAAVNGSLEISFVEQIVNFQ